MNQGQAYEEEELMIDSAHIHEIDLFNFNRQYSGANRLPAIVAAAPETGTQHSFVNKWPA
jgi:hypothetical protein